MKNINQLNKGQKVIFSALEPLFEVVEINTESNKVILLDGLGKQKTTSVTNVFPDQFNFREISTYVREQRQKCKDKIPFGVVINDKLMKKPFLDYWRQMCESAEEVMDYRDSRNFKNEKNSFNIFVDIVIEVFEKMEKMNINGIPVLAQIIPDFD